MNKNDFCRDFKDEKTTLIGGNRIIRDYYNKICFVVVERDLIINSNEEIKIISEIELNNYINNMSIYDELIVTKSEITNFSNIEEFTFYSLLKFNYLKLDILKKIDWDITNFKQEITKHEFEDILNWGFFDLINEDLFYKPRICYNVFHKAYNFFDYPSKPLFTAILDNFYYTFINNSYT